MQNNQEQKIVKFEEIKEKVIAELENRPNGIGISEPVSLLDGFVNQPFGMALSNSIIIGGPTIPMIMLLGKNTGRIYFFALKAILKNEDL